VRRRGTRVNGELVEGCWLILLRQSYGGWRVDLTSPEGLCRAGGREKVEIENPVYSASDRR
jgi:hypothetical protein